MTNIQKVVLFSTTLLALTGVYYVAVLRPAQLERKLTKESASIPITIEISE